MSEHSCRCSQCDREITDTTRRALEVEVQAHYECNHFGEFTELERGLVDGTPALQSEFVYLVEP